MNARRLPLVLLVFASALLVACASPARGPGSPMGDPLKPGEYPKVAATHGLDKYLVVWRGTETSDGVMKVSIDVRAATETDTLNVQYRFEFLDKDNRPIEPATGWRFAQLQPRVVVTLQGTAMDTDAADWRLTIRPAE